MPLLANPHTPGFWIKQIRRFLKHIYGSLCIGDLPIQPLQRQHDYYIMDAVVSLPGISSSAICQNNYCRLFFDYCIMDAVVSLPRIAIQPLQRQQDSYVIDAVVSLPGISSSAICQNKYCRLYL
jgi:hypothetical protein